MSGQFLVLIISTECVCALRTVVRIYAAICTDIKMYCVFPKNHLCVLKNTSNQNTYTYLHMYYNYSTFDISTQTTDNNFNNFQNSY